MKRFLMLVVAFALCLFWGCEDAGPDNTVSPEELNSAVGAINSETRLSGDYMLELTFGEGSVLYYALGDIAWDRSENKVFAEFTQTYLGISSDMENYYSDGKMVSIEDGSPITVDRQSEEILTKFPYFTVPEASADVTKGSNSAGTTYTFSALDTKQLCESIVGTDLYSLVTVIKKPQPELTEYGETKCIYTVSEGKLVSCRFEFDVKLFDTPAYTPNYSQPESEYTIDLHVTAKVSYDGTGEETEIAEYSEMSEN